LADGAGPSIAGEQVRYNSLSEERPASKSGPHRRAARIEERVHKGKDAMTIVVTVKVTDGIVLAADSAATFYGVGPAPKIYNNANKIFNLVRGKPIGA
jgi:20S proteasome alpha/beta subunit